VVTGRPAAAAIDAGDLPLAGGLLALVRPALDKLAPGGVLAVLSTSRPAREDLPDFCRIERHIYHGREELDGRDRHLIERGSLGVPWPASVVAGSAGLPSSAAELLAALPFPAAADPATGFAPRGARVEPGGPRYPFTLLERDRVAPPEVAVLYDQAVAAQWSAANDVPWRTVRPLPGVLDAAVAQIMSFLAENELAALYLPARFLPRVHPAYVEVAQLLAIQMADEARHVDVFLRRARAAGGAPVSSAVTARSLLSLLELEDWSEAELLLAVLGEGTFIDLLRFVEDHAPDDATRELSRRARIDETRHVHFGLAHIRHALAHDPTLAARLESAVRRRSASLAAAGGMPGPAIDALTILAAGGDDPPGVARGHEEVRALLETMTQNRRKRLVHAGFSDEEAGVLTDLHTPNFM
jgi:TusA-related sulfurtransferase